MQTQAPVAHLTVADLTLDPHPALHRLRATMPVAWLPALNAWLVTGYDLAVQVMRDPQRFTVDHPGFSTAQVIGPSMLSLDGPAHGHHRRPFEAPFRRAAVIARFTASVSDHISTLLTALAPLGAAELCRAFAAPVAVHTMLDALGLTAVGAPTVLGWYAAIVDAVNRITVGEGVSAAGTAAFAALREQLLPVLRQAPTANLLAAAGAQSETLTPDQLVANAAVLLFGGIETTEGMIANALYLLLTNAPVLTQVRADPTLLPAVIEETLRLEPAAAVVDRYAVTAVLLGGAAIKAGDLVRVSLSGANRDPAVFADPDRFAPMRSNLRSHVAFAQGPHVCLGLYLARLEAAQAMGQLLTALPNLRLVDLAAARPYGLVFRKPPALAARWAT